MSRARVLFLAGLAFASGAVLIALATPVLLPNQEMLSEGVSKIESDSFFPLLQKEERVSLLFVGDLMLDRSIRAIGERQGYGSILESLKTYLASFDLVVGNLEGPITTSQSVSRGTVPGDPGNMRFTFAPEVSDFLHEHHVRLVSLDNNHTLDFGGDGYRQTKEFLTQASVRHVGDPFGGEDDVLFLSRGALTIAFITFNQFLARDQEETVEEISRANEVADVVVVLAHWGEEYAETPPGYVVSWAERFVDVGADIIIGTHPHVAQEMQKIKNSFVYYSLGNFIFDQYWNTQVSCGLGVELTITKKGDAVSLETTEQYFTMKRSGETVLGCT